jgi:IclR helix-turn-helix domain
MSVEDTIGVSGLARILSTLSDGKARRVSELAQEEGLSRSTAFDLARRLIAAELVARDAAGRLIAGPRLIALSFGRFGLGRLHGPAEAILGWLRDHCDATVSLTCAGPDKRVTLAAFAAPRVRSGATDRTPRMSWPIHRDDGAEAARLELICRHSLSRSERAEIEQLAARTKATLEHYLNDGAAKSDRTVQTEPTPLREEMGRRARRAGIARGQG